METNTAQTRKQIYILGLFLLLLVVAAGALYWLMFRRQYLPTKFFKIDQSIPEEAGLELDPVLREPPAPKVTDLDPDQSDQNLTQMLQGYFYSYEAESQAFHILNQLKPSSSYLQQLAVNLDRLVGFYCWPDTVEGQNGPIETKSMKIMFPAEGQEIYMPGEKFVQLELLEEFVNPERYVIIQLFQPFKLGADNLVQKLVLVGC